MEFFDQTLYFVYIFFCSSKKQFNLINTDLNLNIDFQVVKNRKGVQELWIMTSRFQKVAAGTLSTSEVNFRIQAGKVDDLLFGTSCKGKKQGGGGGGGGGGGYGLISPPRS